MKKIITLILAVILSLLLSSCIIIDAGGGEGEMLTKREFTIKDFLRSSFN